MRYPHAQSDAVGSRFVNASFTPETEAQAREMLRLVQLAFLRRLPQLTWMSSADKMAAADKLTGMVGG
jgi:predicted metalloendopeptidase